MPRLKETERTTTRGACDLTRPRRGLHRGGLTRDVSAWRPAGSKTSPPSVHHFPCFSKYISAPYLCLSLPFLFYLILFLIYFWDVKSFFFFFSSRSPRASNKLITGAIYAVMCAPEDPVLRRRRLTRRVRISPCQEDIRRRARMFLWAGVSPMVSFLHFHVRVTRVPRSCALLLYEPRLGNIYRHQHASWDQNSRTCRQAVSRRFSPEPWRIFKFFFELNIYISPLLYTNHILYFNA
jgi:hypothetical protein